METKNVVGSLIGITVAVLMVAVILVPIIESSQATNVTIDNDEDYYYTASYIDKNDTATHAVTITITASGWELVNNGTQEFSTAQITLVTLDGEDLLRTGGSPSAGNPVVVQMLSESGTLATSTVGTLNDVIEVTFAQGVCTIAINGNPKSTLDYEWAILPDAEGATIMTAPGTHIVSESDNVYANGYLAVGSTNVMIRITGTIDNLSVVAVSTSTGSTATISNVAATVEEYGNNGYELTAITFDVAVDDNSASATFNRIYVPASTVINQDLDSSITSLLSVIPILVIVGIVIAAVGMIATRERD